MTDIAELDSGALAELDEETPILRVRDLFMEFPIRAVCCAVRWARFRL